MLRRRSRTSPNLRRGWRAWAAFSGGAVLLGLVMSPGGAPAQEADKRLEQVEQALEDSEAKSKTLAREADELQKEISRLQDN